MALWPSIKQLAVFSLCLVAIFTFTKVVTSPHRLFKNSTYVEGALDIGNFKDIDLLGAKNGKPHFLVLGDSHAKALASLFDTLGKEAKIKGRLIAGDGFINSRRRVTKDFEDFNEANKKMIAQERPSVVFLHSRWSLGIKGYLPAESQRPGLERMENLYTNGKKRLFGAKAIEAALVDTIEHVTAHGAEQIYIILPIPECGIDIPKAAGSSSFFIDAKGINERFGVPRAEYDKRNKESIAILHSVAQRYPHVMLIDPAPILYGNGNKSVVVQNGRSLYYDDDHLSKTGSYLVDP